MDRCVFLTCLWLDLLLLSICWSKTEDTRQQWCMEAHAYSHMLHGRQEASTEILSLYIQRVGLQKAPGPMIVPPGAPIHTHYQIFIQPNIQVNRTGPHPVALLSFLSSSLEHVSTVCQHIWNCLFVQKKTSTFLPSLLNFLSHLVWIWRSTAVTYCRGSNVEILTNLSNHFILSHRCTNG